MRRPSFITDQRGVATVMVALSLPVLLLFCVLSVDVANWFVHKRHLQTMADAAALAGAGAYAFPNCDNNLIRNKALEYSGKQTYNRPKDSVTPQSRLHAEIMKPNYFGQSKPNDTDLNGLPTPQPCDANKLFVDVKMTEDHLPWFFGSGVVPNINAQARVQLFKATIAEGLLPVGVQDAVPKTVRAWVVDESNGAEIPGSSVLLPRQDPVGNLQHYTNTTPVTFNLPDTTPARLGVRVALSGSTSTTCGAPLVTCYDKTNTNVGLSYIRTYPDPPTAAQRLSPAQPIVRSVALSPGTCGNASFNSATAACTFDVSAKVYWNSDVTPAILLAANKPTLVAKINGGNATSMTYSAASDTWTATGLPFPRGTIGRTGQVDIDWAQRNGTVHIGSKDEGCTTGNGNKCTGTFSDVQRTFWNNPDVQTSQAGPISRLDVLDGAAGPHLGQQVSDLHRCTGPAPANTPCTASLVYDVKVKGSLELAAASDPPVALRVDANQSQSLQCDPNEGGNDGLEDMLANGCPFPYKINTGQACPNNKSDLFNNVTPPWPCVPIRTGAPGNTAKGLNRRVLCNVAFDGANAVNNCKPNGSAISCTHPNQWPLGGPAPTEAQMEHDPRVVDVFVTPFGTFSGSGSDTVPVIRAGRFYITGYTGGGGADNPCQNAGDAFSTANPPDGNISGHFIIGVDPNGGGATNETCDLNEVGNCVAVLVK
jgi:hypothetical protein